MKFTHLLFDLDGTLTDPATGIINSFLYALDKLGKSTVDRKTLGWIIGPPLRQSFFKLLGNEEESERAVAFYREYFSEKGIFENEPIPGMDSVLSDLSEQGITLLVVTSKPRIYAERIIDHFNMTPYFSKIYGAELDGTLTDKADLIKLVLNEHPSVPKSAFCMIGDRDLDIIGAHENGIAGCAVHWGYGTEDELERIHPNFHLRHPQELFELARR